MQSRRNSRNGGSLVGPNDIRAFAAALRAEGRALEGDGFGHVGALKGAFKKASKQLDDLAGELEAQPAVEVPPMAVEDNQACLGRGADNVLGCGCRAAFESLGA